MTTAQKSVQSEAVRAALLPCPMCGCEDIRFCAISVRPYCAECRHGPTNFGSKAEGIAAWNERSRRSRKPANPDITTYMASLAAENEELRGHLCNVLVSLGNGSGAAPSCSMAFLSQIPAEVAAEVASLRAANAKLVDALMLIKRRAFSDAPAEELEDVQRDLRHIHAAASKALLGAQQ
jgi:hypothetical protein